MNTWRDQAEPLTAYQRRRRRRQMAIDWIAGALAFAGFLAGTIYLFTASPR